MADEPLLGGVELGGTKCVCLIGTREGAIRAQTSVPTGRDAAVTLRQIEDVLGKLRSVHGPFAALGIASFGPLELRRDSPGYGRIGSTSKEGWTDCDLAGFFSARFRCGIALSTDVIGAALAEGRWGAARGLSDFAYVTVGTGVGVGLV